MIDEILLLWTGSQNVEDGSRGMFFDAKKLAVLEKVMGQDYVGVSGTNPTEDAASFLQKAYDELRETLYVSFMLQTEYQDIGEKLELSYKVDTGFALISIEDVKEVFNNKLGDNIAENKRVVSDMLRIMRNVYIGNKEAYGAFRNYVSYKGFGLLYDFDRESFISKKYGDEENYISLDESYHIVFTGGGSDTIYGSEIGERIYGESGDDTIYAGKGDDILVGGGGNDTLQGGYGSDTYVFGKGHGNDIVNNYARNGDTDTIYLEGLTREDVTFIKKNKNDMTIRINETGEEITVSNMHYHYGNGYTYMVQAVAFSDGEIISGEELDKLAFLYEGNSDAEDIDMEQKVVVHAGDGNDYISTSSYADVIYGEEGDDTIYAGKGDDILVGGSGNDSLNGGDGSDTYVFGKGHGNDVINNYVRSGDTDTIYLEGLTREDVTFIKKNKNDMTIRINETGEEITVSNMHYHYGNGYTYMVQAVAFSDGEIISGEELDKLAFLYEGNSDAEDIDIDKKVVIHAGDGNDYIHSSSYGDVIYGESGDDTIYAGKGDDILVGGGGNDSLNGGDGSDTYVFGKGHGNDVINNYVRSGDTDTIYLEGLTREDVTFIKKNKNDMTIRINETGEEITVSNMHYYYSNGYNYMVQAVAFSDGEIISGEELDKLAFLYEGNSDAEDIDIDKKVVIHAGDGNDYIHSSSYADVIYGEDGDDTIYAGKGDDVLVGGSGNDKLNGGDGSDTYVFGKGHGNDVINNYVRSGDTDTIYLEGLTREDVTFIKKNKNDMTIRINETGEEITVSNMHYHYGNGYTYMVQAVAFSDGEIISGEELDKLAFLYEGNSDAEDIDIDKKVVIHAGDGNDYIHSSSYGDVIYGEEGDDTIYAGDGDDVLVGGSGNDKLNGGDGSDTYVFHEGHGNDVISNYRRAGEVDRVVLDSNILNAVFERSQNDLYIKYLDGEDSVTINNWYSDDRYQVAEIHADDDYVLTNQKVNSLIEAMATFEENNNIDWKNMTSDHYDDAKNILEQFWIKEG